MLNSAPPTAPISRSHSGTYISGPRAAAMPPRSMTASRGQPKLSSSSSTSALGRRIVTAHEDVVRAGEAGRIDHHDVVHRVQGLDDAGIGKRLLDLLADARRVADRERRWPALREVEPVRDVDQHLAGEIGRTRRPQRVQRDLPARAVEYELGARGGLCERAVRRTGAGPGRPPRGALVRGRARPHRHLVPEGDQLRGNRRADRSRAQDRDPHTAVARAIASNRYPTPGWVWMYVCESERWSSFWRSLRTHTSTVRSR